MRDSLNLGVLSFHGDVSEHIQALKKASKKLDLKSTIFEIRTKNDLVNIHGLIIPGGESTTLSKLSLRENLYEDLKKITAIFGTCAGAIMLAKKVNHKSLGQKTLELMDISIDRNAYGRQIDSFEEILRTELGKISAIYIRAPKILAVGKEVKVLSSRDQEILACEQTTDKNYYLATCFHPELTTTIFHEHFLKKLSAILNRKT